MTFIVVDYYYCAKEMQVMQGRTGVIGIWGLILEVIWGFGLSGDCLMVGCFSGV